MSRPDVVGLMLGVVLLAALGPVGLAPGTVAASHGDGPAQLNLQQEFDQTEFQITVYANSSARWTFLYKQQLANESERDQFRAFAKDFNQNRTQLYRDFKARAESLVENGQNVTGRQMEAKGFSKRAYITGLNDNLGVVRMSFTWTNFAATDGQRVKMGDVFQGGLYIGPNQKLVVSHGPDLVFVSYQPEPTSSSSDSLTWEGEMSFNDERPKVVFAPPGTTAVTRTTAGTPVGPGGLGTLPIAALLAVLLLGAGAAYAYREGKFGGGGGEAGAGAAGEGGGGGPGGAPGGAEAAGGAAAAEEPTPEPAVPDEELLSDEDRVLKLLEEHGGRMKQVNIVDETGWSKSKVSMLLSDMEDEDLISKLRVGRENIISLAGEEPEAAGSPFEEDEE